LGISFICWFGVIWVFFYVFAVFTAEVIDGAGNKGSGDTTFDVQRLLVTFLNMSLRSACFMMKSLLVRGRTSGLGNTLPKCWMNRLSRFLMYQTSD
jgi:hypothetical protein